MKYIFCLSTKIFVASRIVSPIFFYYNCCWNWETLVAQSGNLFEATLKNWLCELSLKALNLLFLKQLVKDYKVTIKIACQKKDKVKKKKKKERNGVRKSTDTTRKSNNLNGGLVICET